MISDIYDVQTLLLMLVIAIVIVVVLLPGCYIMVDSFDKGERVSERKKALLALVWDLIIVAAALALAYVLR